MNKLSFFPFIIALISLTSCESKNFNQNIPKVDFKKAICSDNSNLKNKLNLENQYELPKRLREFNWSMKHHKKNQYFQLYSNNLVSQKFYYINDLKKYCDLLISDSDSSFESFIDSDIKKEVNTIPSLTATTKQETRYKIHGDYRNISFLNHSSTQHDSDFLLIKISDDNTDYGANKYMPPTNRLKTFDSKYYVNRILKNDTYPVPHSYEQQVNRQSVKNRHSDLILLDSAQISDRAFWGDILEFNIEAFNLYNELESNFSNHKNLKEFYFNKKKNSKLKERVKLYKESLELFLSTSDFGSTFGLRPLSHFHPLFVQVLIELMVKDVDLNNPKKQFFKFHIALEKAQRTADSNYLLKITDRSGNTEIKMNQDIQKLSNIFVILQTLSSKNCSEWGLKPHLNNFFVKYIMKKYIANVEGPELHYINNFFYKFDKSCGGRIEEIFTEIFKAPGNTSGITVNLLSEKSYKRFYEGSPDTKYAGFVADKDKFSYNIYKIYKGL